MSRKYTFTALAVALGLVAGACSEQPAPTAADEAVWATDFQTFDNFNNNPDGGGLHIFRFENHVFFLIFDSESPLVAVHSTTPDCGGILEPADVQGIVEDPSNPMLSQIRELTLADPINIFIVDLSQGGTCFGLKLVASGQGKLINTDNDLFVFLREHNNHNAFGFIAHGQLTGTGGERVHYNGLFRTVWDGVDFNSFITTEKFNLK